MANNHFHINSFNSRPELVDVLSKKIIDSLAVAIEKKEYATLALSGGSTPVKLLQTLSNREFDWEKVRVTLVDERWVDPSSDKSNEKLIRDNLLINKAKMAKFFCLKTDEKFAKDGVTTVCTVMQKFSHELDVVILGMGLDGHTASFFPHTQELLHALNTNDFVCATTATVEPKERMTLSKNYLLTAQELILHIEGKEKKDVFDKASRSDDESTMPIISMMRQKEPLLEVYYAD